ncbi:lactate dehydrogenase-like 2-hydroxyacid dehydrogenase [Alkalibaculum bacchi]|uniref:Lactate dehydrogenase-like 2-hydroxyacid dehydrogenase n=1 Tax=Alkalibaculum bacchi TaxID=645887 RepID=A0A366ID03_9FIRM|nr:D-isomer specific 2-hydroxyacid dehydrogenase family protein [Alkalibaculum bacchi]RBP67318.1 lactate dehydrogenase-like 2-hydroxyacid dehydrogenase [Alkalibaculum bacchi]
MSNYKIAIVNSSSFGKWFSKHIERLEAIGPVERFTFDNDIDGVTLAKELEGFNIIISSVTPFFTKEFFEHKDELLLISRHGIGYNNIDLDAAKEKKTIVTIVPPLVERDAVAENAIANLMSILRRTVDSSKAAADNRWTERATFMGHNLTGKTVGVIGCGNIGSRVAEILKHGFNTRLLVTDPNVDNEWAEKHGAEIVELDELLTQADVISLNASLNDTSYQILDKEAFSKVKRGVYITNTARGALIEEEALLEAIDKGIVCAVATDVMVKEPAPNTHPYYSNARILVTPHTSAYTFECLEGMGEKCVTDVERIIKGETPDSVVSK